MFVKFNNTCSFNLIIVTLNPMITVRISSVTSSANIVNTGPISNSNTVVITEDGFLQNSSPDKGNVLYLKKFL